MVSDVIKYSMTAAIDKLFADGAYNGFLSCIKVRKNARVGKKDHILRNLSMLVQRIDLQKWKEDIVSYGKI